MPGKRGRPKHYECAALVTRTLSWKDVHISAANLPETSAACRKSEGASLGASDRSNL